MADSRYIITTVECPGCKTKQKIHVASGFGAAQERGIVCLNCGNHFKVTVSNTILRGPFPA